MMEINKNLKLKVEHAFCYYRTWAEGTKGGGKNKCCLNATCSYITNALLPHNITITSGSTCTKVTWMAGTNLAHDLQSNPNDNHHNTWNQKQTNKNYCMFQRTDVKENSQTWTQEVKGIQHKGRDKSAEHDTRTSKRRGSATSLHGQHMLFCKLQGWQHWGNPSMNTLAVLLPVWQQRLLPSVVCWI